MEVVMAAVEMGAGIDAGRPSASQSVPALHREE